MIETTPFAPLIAQLDAALEESTARERQATRRGDLDAIELEQERRRNLVNARYQLEVLQELWPEMVGRQLVPRPVGAQPVPVPVGEPLAASGWLLKRRARRTQAHAEIFTDGIGILAEADILFTDLPPRLLEPNEAESRFGWRLYD